MLETIQNINTAMMNFLVEFLGLIILGSLFGLFCWWIVKNDKQYQKIKKNMPWLWEDDKDKDR